MSKKLWICGVLGMFLLGGSLVRAADVHDETLQQFTAIRTALSVAHPVGNRVVAKSSVFKGASLMSGADLHVGPGQAFTAIQAAIEAAQSGDRIIVEPGTYYEHINFLGKAVEVTSTNPDDPAIVAATIIDAGGSGSVVSFVQGEGPDAILTGFTLTGGQGTPEVFDDETIYWGAGIYCNQSSPRIEKNIISGNIGPRSETQIGYGGGVCLYDSDALVALNLIRNNDTWAGGGILTFFGNAVVAGNIIAHNNALVGGGLCLVDPHECINNTLYGNQAEIGGCLYIGNQSGENVIANNIFAHALGGGGVYWNGDNNYTYFVHNDLWDNSGGNYGGSMSDQTGLKGNISQNPLFVDAGNNDFHLSAASPCISAGRNDWASQMPAFDRDGDPRIFAARVDMGADEYVGYLNPIADAGPDQYTDEIVLITLDGTGSYFDPCVVNRYYQWEQTAGPTVTLGDSQAEITTFMPTEESEYRFTLVVSDGTTPSSPDEITIVVGNRLPVADASVNKAYTPDTLVMLDGSKSYDLDPGDEITFAWQQMGGPAVNLEGALTAYPSFYAAEVGDYTFDLIVNDGFENSLPATVRIIIVDWQVQQTDIGAGFITGDYIHYPDISGDNVVYGVGSACDFTWRIFCRNLATDATNNFEAGGIDTQPRIDGNTVVWCGGINWGSPWYHEPSNVSVFARRLDTGQQKTLRQYTWTESYSHPAISGTRMVWLEHRNLDLYPKGTPANWYNTPYNICGADITDLGSPVYFTVAENVGQRDPYPYNNYTQDYNHVLDISGNLVVWEGNGNIYGADITDLNAIRVFTICDHPATQLDPAISGTTVVWKDQRDDGGDIYGANIADPDHIQIFPLVRRGGTQEQPAISGSMFTYVEGSTVGTVQACQLLAGHCVFDVFIQGDAIGASPAVDNNSMVWEDWTVTGAFGAKKVRGVHLEFFGPVPIGPVKNLTTGKQYACIQHGVTAASAGDIIEVDDGVYTGPGNRDINFYGKAITLRSVSGPDHCILDCQGTPSEPHRGFKFCTNEGPDTILEGFTIRNGFAPIDAVSNGSYSIGGAMYCRNASPEIRDCIFTANTADIAGGALCMWNSNPVFKNCQIVNNSGPWGGGMYADQSRPRFTHTTFYGNQATMKGGAMVLANGCWGQFQNTIIWGNTSPLGSQIALDTQEVWLAYCDVQGGKDEIVVGNGATLLWGMGNIEVYPCFVDAAAGDFHLKSEGWRWHKQRHTWVWDSVTSRCIDAGCPGSLLGEEPLTVPDDPQNEWGINLRVDMGSYGGTAEASMPPYGWVITCDMTNDGIVDTVDLACLGEDWLMAQPDRSADVNRDNMVNLGDFAMIAGEWLQSTLWYE